MGLIAPVLMAIAAFYWVAGCFTIIAWLKAISNLCFGNFIRAAIWFNVGLWLLFWWFGELDKVNFWPGAITFVLLGVLGTLVQYQKRKAMLATPTWTTPADAEIELVVPAQQILELDKSEYRSIQ